MGDSAVESGLDSQGTPACLMWVQGEGWGKGWRERLGHITKACALGRNCEFIL